MCHSAFRSKTCCSKWSERAVTCTCFVTCRLGLHACCCAITSAALQEVHHLTCDSAIQIPRNVQSDYRPKFAPCPCKPASSHAACLDPLSSFRAFLMCFFRIRSCSRAFGFWIFFHSSRAVDEMGSRIDDLEKSIGKARRLSSLPASHPFCFTHIR